MKNPPGKYNPAPCYSLLGDEQGAPFFDAVEPAAFPKHIVRFRNQEWAEKVGLGGLSEEEWIGHFGRFTPLPDNIQQPIAIRYHGHQFRSYNPQIGDGRGFLFAQLRDDQGRLLDLGTKGSGQTPYSRFGDGRLTLKGGVREVSGDADAGSAGRLYVQVLFTDRNRRGALSRRRAFACAFVRVGAAVPFPCPVRHFSAAGLREK